LTEGNENSKRSSCKQYVRLLFRTPRGLRVNNMFICHCVQFVQPFCASDEKNKGSPSASRKAKVAGENDGISDNREGRQERGRERGVKTRTGEDAKNGVDLIKVCF